uniref:Uncharacterized protein n=1 Tax=Cucumis melo TaxID=3656 RepID=A0A9I9CUJ0_CUCME
MAARGNEDERRRNQRQKLQIGAAAKNDSRMTIDKPKTVSNNPQQKRITVIFRREADIRRGDRR